MPRPSLNRRRVQITLPPAILDDVSRLFGSVTRSTVIELALTQLINRTEGKRTNAVRPTLTSVSLTEPVQGEFDAEGKGSGTPTHPKRAVDEIQGQLPEAI
jgi:hypothetical protein